MVADSPTLWFSTMGFQHAAYLTTPPETGSFVVTLCELRVVACPTEHPQLCLNCEREWQRVLGAPTELDLRVQHAVLGHVNALYREIAALQKQFRVLQRKISGRVGTT